MRPLFFCPNYGRIADCLGDGAVIQVFVSINRYAPEKPETVSANIWGYGGGKPRSAYRLIGAS